MNPNKIKLSQIEDKYILRFGEYNVMKSEMKADIDWLIQRVKDLENMMLDES